MTRANMYKLLSRSILLIHVLNFFLYLLKFEGGLRGFT